MNIIYLTSDLSSAHTEKRVNWFKQNGYQFRLLGCANDNNTDTKIDKNIFLFKSGFRGYIQRILFSFFLIVRERNSLKNNILIVRGFEYVLFLWIFKINFIKEITDIPTSFFSNKILIFFFKFILKNKTIFFTSYGFNKIFNFKITHTFIWHNNPVTDKKPTINNPKNRIIYAGYLRELEILSQNLKNLKIDLWGKLNIITQNYNSEFVLKNYKGTFKFENLSNLYSRYRLSYISDFYSKNSNYNLTNRLYETILNYCIPIELNNNYQKSFLDKLGIFYLDSDISIKNFNENLYLKYSKINYQILNKEILKDNKKINNFINNYG